MTIVEAVIILTTTLSSSAESGGMVRLDITEPGALEIKTNSGKGPSKPIPAKGLDPLTLQLGDNFVGNILVKTEKGQKPVFVHLYDD